MPPEQAVLDPASPSSPSPAQDLKREPLAPPEAGTEGVEPAEQAEEQKAPDPLETFLAEADEALVSKLLQHEKVRGRVTQERQNAVAKREAELRREAGRIGPVRTALSAALAKAGVDPASLSKEQIDAFNEPLAAYQLANLRELALAIPEALMRQYDLPPDVRTAAADARDSGEPDAYDRYLSTLIDGAVEKRVKEATAKIEKEHRARVGREAQALALEQANKGKSVPPPVRGAVAAAGGRPEPVPDSRWMRMSQAEKDAWYAREEAYARAHPDEFAPERA